MFSKCGSMSLLFKKKKKGAEEHDGNTALKNKLAEINLYERTGYENY